MMRFLTTTKASKRLLDKIAAALSGKELDGFALTTGGTYDLKRGLPTTVQEKKCCARNCPFKARVSTVRTGTGANHGYVLIEAAGAHLLPQIKRLLEPFVIQQRPASAVQVWKHLATSGIDITDVFTATHEHKEMEQVGGARCSDGPRS